MRRLLPALAAAAALAALIFLLSPWFAFRGLAAAARDGDVQGLAELIDYPAVRAGLRAQAAPDAPPPPSVWTDPVGAVRRALEPPRASAPDVERHMSPRGLYALTGAPRPFPRVR